MIDAMQWAPIPRIRFCLLVQQRLEQRKSPEFKGDRLTDETQAVDSSIAVPAEPELSISVYVPVLVSGGS
jgi:hypothetical protein